MTVKQSVFEDLERNTAISKTHYGFLKHKSCQANITSFLYGTSTSFIDEANAVFWFHQGFQEWPLNIPNLGVSHQRQLLSVPGSLRCCTFLCHLGKIRQPSLVLFCRKLSPLSPIVIWHEAYVVVVLAQKAISAQRWEYRIWLRVCWSRLSCTERNLEKKKCQPLRAFPRFFLHDPNAYGDTPII